MRITPTILVILSASLVARGCAVAAGAQDSRAAIATVDNTEERALIAAENAWVNAAIAGDADAFGRFMADEYAAQGPDGALITKKAWVEKMREGQSTFKAVKFCSMVVRVNGDAALVTADFCPDRYEGRQGQQQEGVGNGLLGEATGPLDRAGQRLRRVVTAMLNMRTKQSGLHPSPAPKLHPPVVCHGEKAN
jgi:ketosteroid isomerase-like protein